MECRVDGVIVGLDGYFSTTTTTTFIFRKRPQTQRPPLNRRHHCHHCRRHAVGAMRHIGAAPTISGVTEQTATAPRDPFLVAPVQVRAPSTPYDPPGHHLRGGGSANAASRPAFTPSRLQYTNVCSTLTTPLPFDNHINTFKLKRTQRRAI